ncbi:DUF547 domain-containing protein [Vibrio gangliei]|uniref:DUF547 domain-containing protein n=1 Tax=Vibrio gangliei TaxID=2077090 RepID=UPI000D0162EB|nr:DUF547 domain-containing protein [Vibrio gangliei]
MSRLLCLFLLRSFLLSLSFSSIAAPKADLWDIWDSSNEQNTQSIDHSDWQTILDRHLVQSDQNTLFSYSSFTKSDKQLLTGYLQTLSQLDPRQFNRAEQFAYWVNLYNALTVQLIIEHYPIQSITKLGGIFSFGPWDDKLIHINQQALSLNNIEHRILRPIWRDKRIHYAVNCASLGCPNLQPHAFTSSNSEQLLTQAEYQFLHSDKGVKIDAQQLQLSSIFKWYAEDFGGEQQLLNYLTQFHPEIAKSNKKPSYDYDWALNQTE